IVKEYASPNREDQRKYSREEWFLVTKTRGLGARNQIRVRSYTSREGILPFGRTSSALLGWRSHSARNWTISKRRLRCTLPITISSKRTARCVARPRWKQGLKRAHGRCLI